MKTDHFTEFRRHTENPCNACNSVTPDENSATNKDFHRDVDVTRGSGRHVTRVTDGSPHAVAEVPVTRVTWSATDHVTNPHGQIPEQNQGQFVDVTRVTRVTRENDDVKETRSIGPLCLACHSANLSVSPAGGLICRGCGRFLFLSVGPDAPIHPTAPLCRCGALVCPDCHVHSPSPHRETCRTPRLEPCGSRWFWLSLYRAVKCVACEGPANLALVQGWVTVREDRIPDEIFRALNVGAPAQ